MLDLWSNAEPFLKVMYTVILVCIPLLFLSIYKIWRWTRREDIVERRRQYNETRRANAFFALHRSIGKVRMIWYCAGCAAIITLSALLASSLSTGWRVGLLIVAFLALYLVNNWYVAMRWRCPACGERLPCLVGRSALRPKWTESCPHCDYGNPIS